MKMLIRLGLLSWIYLNNNNNDNEAWFNVTLNSKYGWEEDEVQFHTGFPADQHHITMDSFCQLDQFLRIYQFFNNFNVLFQCKTLLKKCFYALFYITSMTYSWIYLMFMLFKCSNGYTIYHIY